MRITKHVISLFLTIFVIGLIVLSGPASAVTVDISQPNNANKGSDISFSVDIDINDPDAYLPVKYVNVIFSGPNGFSKTCKVLPDGTDNCDDVDFTITNNAVSGYGYGYGYDLGYGYNFGYGYGLSNGQVKIDAIWHTSSDLTDGAYSVKTDIHAEGSVNHDFSSSEKSFSISTDMGIMNNGYYGGGAGGATPITETIAPTPAPVVTAPTPAETGETGETEGMGEVTGAAIGGGQNQGLLYNIINTAINGIVSGFLNVINAIGSFFSWIF